jgi:hypothetical protein
VADRLLGLRVRIPPGGMDVCVVCCTIGTKAKPGQSGQSSTDKVQRENRKWSKTIVCGPLLAGIAGSSIAGGMYVFVVCCKVKDKRQSAGRSR